MTYKIIALMIITYSGNAHAYLDPGTGSIIIQSVIAGIAGAFFSIKLYWFRIKSWFSKRNNTQTESEVDKAREADDH